MYIHVIQKSKFATPDIAMIYAWVTTMNNKLYSKREDYREYGDAMHSFQTSMRYD